MKPLYRNLFLLFGLCAIAFMVYSFPEGWETIKRNPTNVLLYLPGVVGIWFFVYLCNAWAFQILVNTSDHDKHLSFAHAFKLTVSGFAFSYTTPFGSGGAPYRVMELSRYIGTPRAVSSVALYSMMHVFSHFFLWTTALLAFVIAHFDVMTTWLWTLFAIFLTVFVATAVFFFLQLQARHHRPPVSLALFRAPVAPSRAPLLRTPRNRLRHHRCQHPFPLRTSAPTLGFAGRRIPGAPAQLV